MPAERDRRVDLREHRRRVLPLLHRRQHVAGTNRVHAHRGRELECHRAGKQDHARLRCVVVRVVLVPGEPVRRGGHQDHATVAGDHPSRRLLRAMEDAGEVHVEHTSPVHGLDLEKRLAHRDAGIRDEHVDAAEQLVGAGERYGDLGFVGDVAAQRGRKPGDPLSGRRHLVLADGQRDYAGSFVEETAACFGGFGRPVAARGCFR